MSEERIKTHEELAAELRQSVRILQGAGRNDLLLQAIGVPLLEELRIEAARGQLSRLRITRDYRFLLVDFDNREIDLQPVHKAVYLLFLAHPEGIEFKRLSDYREELTRYYMAVSKIMDKQKVEESVGRLVNKLMDEYSASYYVISSHTTRHIEGSNRIWYQRAKLITLPRHLVENLAADEID